MITRRLIVASAPLVVLAPSLAFAAPAPAFTARDIDGKTRSLSEFKGKTVVLEWVNEGCPYVKKHYSGNMQGLQQAATADGVVWLSVASSAPGKQGYFADGAQAKTWMSAKGAKPTTLLLDPEGVVATAYKAKTTPHMYVIDPAGQLVYQGAIDDKPSNKVEDIATAKNYVAAALSDLKAGRKVAVPASQPYGCAVKYKDA
ncbi:redoxin domain-containing protein [Caulobacter sp. CCNWLY153]|jgi:peroxiredoxin|uniref:Thioredoxin family protein n=1 Tax=Caulobacter radicis TaxID=2172650 RepID=A0A2T9J1W2_9CAUL|nr:redoxin domain-containing protein [Caulobacter radicis]PVM74063.1 thioredoxin family protein [Caulobacter radicis]